MKKLFFIWAVFVALLSNSALAKTEGSYIGIDFLSVKSSYYQRSFLYDNNPSGFYDSKPTQSGSNFGLGTNYKYAFNFNNFFIAPGIMFEQDSFGPKTNGNNSDSIKIRNRYGFRTDIGYDINRYIAPYATVGYAWANYRTNSAYYDSGSNVINSIKNGTTNNFLFGGGLKFSLAKSLALNLEYNYQAIDARNNVPSAASHYTAKSKSVVRIDTAKIGLSYNF